MGPGPSGPNIMPGYWRWWQWWYPNTMAPEKKMTDRMNTIPATITTHAAVV